MRVMVNSERTDPDGFRACARLIRPTALGMALATMRSSQARAPGPSTSYFAKDDSSSRPTRSEEHTSELQSLMRISYAVFCLKTKNKNKTRHINNTKVSYRLVHVDHKYLK